MPFVQFLVNTFSSFWVTIVIVGGYMSCALLIALVCHKVKKRFHVLGEMAEHFRQIFGVVATMLGIVLGFLVVVVWQQYQTVQQNVVAEANAVHALQRHIDMLPSDLAEPMQTQLREYIDTVITQEWPGLATGQESPKAQAEVDDLWAQAYALPNIETNEVEARSKIIDSLTVISQHHRTRIFDSRNVLPTYFWSIMLIFSFLIVVVVNLFSYKTLRLRLSATALMSFCIGLMFLLITFIDYPFSGDTKIQPVALQFVRELLK